MVKVKVPLISIQMHEMGKTRTLPFNSIPTAGRELLTQFSITRLQRSNLAGLLNNHREAVHLGRDLLR